MSQSERRPFIHRPKREDITREPDPAGRYTDQFPDMIGYRNQGGGKVPEDFAWNTNPKQWQEELTEGTLAERYQALRVLPERPAQAQLPEGSPKPEGAK
ncbi:hypothetical protein FGE12_11675 [Aggregicoccus sp. 17bor-14]|uniref:hypothetical protein n=1 Tax=Myxococcaceae TaxID=31 RepID=UPI00129D1C8B|nr:MULTISPECIES: hypothetical protein [Myxococcaceae]MBF5043047.1 hypothetical protein [Simulacricoccus sp. 17bor-14]MRI88810.1 hypothetical protein [Aggregicoccus sp. 17bor-14]